MILSLFSLGEAAISQTVIGDGGKKPPPKRQVAAKADAVAVPEAR